MANQTDQAVKGGSFLIDEIKPEQVFTPEDFTEEHHMIAKTTEDFVQQEVLPVLDRLENHEFDLSVKLLKKGRGIGAPGHRYPGRLRRTGAG